MATSFRLSLPTDIPWKKVCVTEDMMDRVVCDPKLPPKWQSSIAVFKYKPEEEYQLFPDYDITYLKVTATVTGYQALVDEIQGEIDWDGLDVSVLDGLAELLNSYYPCTGAILQVVVGPPGRDPDESLDQYPFFFDFEPKKRELYEMATDTKERQSRSIETLNMGNSAATTQSLEALDTDMGGGGFGVQGSYAGTGGGFSVQGSQGQWGTKKLNTDQSQVTRTTESGTEKRESYSHTTQLSQMYHLLDSYHLGTNRAVFFIQPRPHVIEEPSGFVRGPRKVEGMQEFFLVVAQPKDLDDFCVSVRLDTAHLMETPILDYDYKPDISNLATATAPVPTGNDIPDGTTTREACFGSCWDVTYNCFRTHDVDDQIYQAPDGYIIEGYNTIVNESSNGSTSVQLAPGNKTLTVHAEAHGHICFEGSGLCVDCPDEIQKFAGSARRQVQVNLRSEDPIVPVGTEQQLVITTRGLCCCARAPRVPWPDIRVTGVSTIPADLGGRIFTAQPQSTADEDIAVEALAQAQYLSPGLRRAAAKSHDHAPCNCGDSARHSMADGSDSQYERTMSIRQANAVSEFIRGEMVKSFNDPRPGAEPKPFVETDLFIKQLEMYARRSRRGRLMLADPVIEEVPKGVLSEVAKRLTKEPKEVTRRDLLRFRNQDLARATNMSIKELAQIKRDLLGIRFKNRENEADVYDIDEDDYKQKG